VSDRIYRRTHYLQDLYDHNENISTLQRLVYRIFYRTKRLLGFQPDNVGISIHSHSHKLSVYSLSFAHRHVKLKVSDDF